MIPAENRAIWCSGLSFIVEGGQRLSAGLPRRSNFSTWCTSCKPSFVQLEMPPPTSYSSQQEGNKNRSSDLENVLSTSAARRICVFWKRVSRSVGNSNKQTTTKKSVMMESDKTCERCNESFSPLNWKCETLLIDLKNNEAFVKLTKTPPQTHKYQDLLLRRSLVSYLAALFLPEDGRGGVSRGAALEGDAPPLGCNLVSRLCCNLGGHWKKRRRRATHQELLFSVKTPFLI